MKILSAEELNQHSNATIRGAAEGTAAGLAFSLPASLLLNRRWGYYRSLPLSLKMLGVVFATVPALAIQAERRGLEFERSHWYVTRHHRVIKTLTRVIHRKGLVRERWSLIGKRKRGAQLGKRSARKARSPTG